MFAFESQIFLFLLFVLLDQMLCPSRSHHDKSACKEFLMYRFESRTEWLPSKPQKKPERFSVYSKLLAGYLFFFSRRADNYETPDSQIRP